MESKSGKLITTTFFKNHRAVTALPKFYKVYKKSSKMKRFEYKIKEIGGDMHDPSYLPGKTEEDQLNEEGKLGWELVSVMDAFAFFKREIV